MKLLIIKFSQPSCYYLFSMSNILPEPCSQMLLIYIFHLGGLYLGPPQKVHTSTNPHLDIKPEDHPLTAVRDWLLNIFAATLHIWKCVLYLQPQDVLYRGDKGSI
jgi:hypothetical protein